MFEAYMEPPASISEHEVSEKVLPSIESSPSANDSSSPLALKHELRCNELMDDGALVGGWDIQEALGCG
jgi:hypothetical protein